jgi:hypothetical protein
MEVEAQKAVIFFSLSPGFRTFIFPSPTLSTFLPTQRSSSMEDEVAALVSSPSYRLKSPPKSVITRPGY